MNTYTSIPKTLATAQLYVYTASEHPEIRQKMNVHGFTPKRIQEGKSMLEDLKMLFDHQTEKYSEKKKLTSQIKAHEDQARQTLVDHAEIVRYVFRKDADTLNEFNISNISRKVDEWPFQADFFYKKALRHLDVLTPQGLTQAEIGQSQAMIEAIANARNQRMHRKGEAEEATRLRNQKLKALNGWMKNFRNIARTALQDSPQLLEAVGIKVK